MNIFFKLITLVFLIFMQSIFANTSDINSFKKEKLLIGFYGRPNTKSLGILGQSNIDKLVQRIREKENYFNEELDEKFDIKMAFHIIYGLATPDAGRRNSYMLRLSHNSLIKYIERAEKEGFNVIIDLQMGANSLVEALTLVLKYLKYDHVHLALDPEFKIPKHRRYVPGKFVGFILGNDLNKAQELINNYVIKNNLNKKDLIVHMFKSRMLRKKDEVKKFDNVNLIYNIDGHGNPAIKIKIFNNLYTENELTIADSGLKIFLKNDKIIMTPKQILGLESTRGRRIWTQPYYINFQ